MKRSMAALGFAAATALMGFASPALSSTSASDCLGRIGGPITHVIRTLESGYFPTVTYVCPGDTVSFVNEKNYWTQFQINWDPSTTNQHSGWHAPNATYTSMEFEVLSTMTSVEFVGLTAHPYYPSGFKGFILLGIAPWELDDLDENYDYHDEAG